MGGRGRVRRRRVSLVEVLVRQRRRRRRFRRLVRRVGRRPRIENGRLGRGGAGGRRRRQVAGRGGGGADGRSRSLGRGGLGGRRRRARRPLLASRGELDEAAVVFLDVLIGAIEAKGFAILLRRAVEVAGGLVGDGEIVVRQGVGRLDLHGAFEPE